MSTEQNQNEAQGGGSAFNVELDMEYEVCFADTGNWFTCSERDAVIFRASGDYEVRKIISK